MSDKIDKALTCTQRAHKAFRTRKAVTEYKKGQEAFRRKLRTFDVTDVLVARGNTEVLTSVARNDGARLSSSGFLNLVKRSEDDFKPCSPMSPARSTQKLDLRREK